MAIDIKRQTDDGQMVDARDNELASLGTKAAVASTASLLKNLDPCERLAWAIETKNEANELYKEKRFREAMGKYVECLAASDFGKNGDDSGGNVDKLIIPVLCNLAACCIQVEEWGKAVSFADQAILLRPTCKKAHFRKGIGLIHLGEYELALSCLRTIDSSFATYSADGDCNEEDTETDTDDRGTSQQRKNNAVPSTELSVSDQQRLPGFILQAKRGIQQQRQQRLKQKESLAKAFARNSLHSSNYGASPNVVEIPFPKFDDDETETKIESSLQTDVVNASSLKPSAGDPSQNVELMTLWELIRFFIEAILTFLLRLIPFRKTKTN